MAKVKVVATEDFFDQANYQQRRKGDEFIVRAEYVDKLGKLVTLAGKKKEKPEVIQTKEKSMPSGPNG